MDNDDSDPAGPFEALQEFIEALRRASETGEASESGSLGDRARVDFDYSVRTGLGPASPSRGGRPRFEAKPDAPSGRSPPTHVDVDGDERVVTVDLGDRTVQSSDAVSTAVENGRLHVSTGGDPLVRVDVGDGPLRVEEVDVNNGVLEVTVVQA